MKFIMLFILLAITLLVSCGKFDGSYLDETGNRKLNIKSTTADAYYRYTKDSQFIYQTFAHIQQSETQDILYLSWDTNMQGMFPTKLTLREDGTMVDQNGTTWQ